MNSILSDLTSAFSDSLFLIKGVISSSFAEGRELLAFVLLFPILFCLVGFIKRFLH